MKRLSTLLALVACLFVSIPDAQSIITDPEDHVYYYSGLIAPTRDFVTPDFMGGQDWAYGSTGIVFPTHTTMRNFLGVTETDTVYALIVNNLTGRMDLRLPYCDSIFVEFWGTGQRGVKITNDHNDKYGWNALEGNRPVTAGARFGITDSVTVSLTPTKLSITEKPTGLVYINSIKIYGPIEQSDVPVFDGVIAGWDFKYRPKESGTVDLESLVTDEDGLWEDDAHYAKYASDLGVVRGKLTSSCPADGMTLGHDCGVQAVKLEPAGKNDIDDFTQDSLHANYWQIDFSSTGYQEMSLLFDFNLRYASDSCVVVYSIDNGTTWKRAGAYLAPEDESALTSVNVSLPEEVSNQKNVCIRLIQGNGADDANGQFILANLSINGFEYVAYKEDALDIAYINTAESRIRTGERAVNTKDSLDTVVLPALMDSFNVTIFYPEKYQTAIDSVSVNEMFADYDVVVLSSLVSADAKIAQVAEYLVGNKPLLNMNADTYSSGNWHWATPGNGNISSGLEKTLSIDQTYRYHPVFTGLTINEQNEISLYDTLGANGGVYEGVEGFVTTSYKGSGYLMATSSKTPSLSCIHELNTHPAAKYMLLGMNSDNYQYISQDGVQLLVNAIRYLGEPSLFVIPDFTMTATGASVENMTTLKSALAYDYSSRNMSEIVIEMQPSTDVSGLYELGSEGLIFSKYDDLTLKAADGQQVVVWGNFSPSNALYAGTLTYERLIWDGTDRTNASGLLCIDAKDTLTSGLEVRNCTFRNVSQGSILQADNCAEAYVSGLKFEYCVFDAFSGGDMLQLSDAADYTCDTFVFCNNIVKDFQGVQPFKLTRQGAANGYSLDIENNLFYKMGASTLAEQNFLDCSTNPGSTVSIIINDNIFYERYSAEAYPQSKLSLFEVKNNQKVSLIMQRNFFYPDNVCAADGKDNLYVASGDVPADYSALTKDAMGMETVFENEESLYISKSSPLYMAGVNYGCIGPEQQYIDRQKAGVMTASTMAGLKICLSIAIAGDTIELENCQDEGGVYLSGNAGLAYPQHGGDLTIRAAEGHQPTFFGRMSSSNGMNLDNLVIEGISWNGGNTALTGYNNETYAPFFIVRKDTVSGLFLIKNCSFEKFNYQPVIRTKECAGAVIGKLAFRKCYFDEMGWNCKDGKTGHHFMHFDQANTYALDRFEFTDNIVKNFHGSQFFNLGSTGTTSTDSIKEIVIEHNLFYKIGGNATSERQFLGYEYTPAGCKVDIRINNNLFYERWSYEHYPVSDLAMFEPDSLQQVSLKVMNNLFYDTDVMARLNTKVNLPVIGSSVVAEYNNLYLSTFNLSDAFDDSEYLEIYGESPLYTGGTNGTYIGSIQSYTGIPQDNIPNKTPAGVAGYYVRDGILYVEAEAAGQLDVYDLLGNKVSSRTVSQGLNAIGHLDSQRIYLVRMSDKVFKVIL